MTRFLSFLSVRVGLLLLYQTSWTQADTNETIRHWADVEGATPRIIGGQDADQGRFPYYVMLLKRNQFVCGGTLIASDVVLSAAHCDIGLTHALIGKFSRNVNEMGESEEIEIERAHLHPDWDYDSGRFDQMLLKLKTRSTKPYINVNQQPSLPEPEEDPITIIGVGRTAYQGPAPDVLQTLNVLTISNNDCEKFKGNGYNYKELVMDDMVCVVQGNDEGQCHGDSGGPYLMLGDSYEDDLQIGLVSWGVECSQNGAPGVGSRTSASDFIQTQTCSMATEPPQILCSDFISETPTESLVPSESPSALASASPSRVPSSAPSLLCADYFEVCSSNDDCCSQKCLMSMCRPAPRAAKQSVAQRGGVRGGAAVRSRLGN